MKIPPRLQKTSPSLLAFVLGTLSVAALPPYYCFILLFFTLSGWLLLLNAAPSPRKAFAVGYWFGFGFFAFGFSWIGNALLIDPAPLAWLYPFCLLAGGAFFGLFFAFPAWISCYFKGIAARYLSFSALLVIFEWLRSFVLTGFPWNLWGSVLAFCPQALQGASLAGTYGLSLWALLIGTAPAFWLQKRCFSRFLISLALIFGLGAPLCVYGNWRLEHQPQPQREIKVRLVQPAIPQNMKWNPQTLAQNFNEYIDMSRLPGQDGVDFVIWGETASPYALDLDLNALKAAASAAPKNGYLITGLVRYEQTTDQPYIPVNSLFVLNRQGEIAAVYDKFHLVPFGEYIPLRTYLPDSVRPLTNTISDFKPGPGPQKLSLAGYPDLGALICYEIIFPHQIVPPLNPPSWVVNITNDGWYGDSAGPYQHLVATRLRAIEEGISIIRVANTGISAIISPYGSVLASIPLNQKAILDAGVPIYTNLSTIYGDNGNIIPLILCLVNLGLAWVFKRKTIKSEDKAIQA